MMNHNEIDQIKDKLYEIYKKIKYISCPALNNELIYFDDRGFRHLVYKDRRRRSIVEQARRFRLFNYVVGIVKNTNKVSESRIFKDTKFWSLSRNIENAKVVVIIRQTNDGRKHFFSVMSQKNKKLS